MRRAVSLCFFLSGLSGLCFEVVWTRALERVFGSSSLAVSSVLTVYMAGLALGSYLGGRLASRLVRPARAYALCEVGVALLGLAVLLWVGLYEPLYRAMWGWWRGGAYGLLSLARLGLCFVALLGPTTLMGATLPILARFLAKEAEENGGATPGELAAGTSRLYALNLIGAGAGAWLAGFWIVPGLGLRGATLFAAGVNLLLPLVLWMGSRRSATDEAGQLLRRAAREAEAQGAAQLDPLSPTARRWVVLSAGLSGLLSMLYQVLWTRALAIVLGASTYAFSLIVTCFLFGLFTGSALAARLLQRLRAPLLALGLVQLGVALSVGLLAGWIDDLPRAYLAIASPHQGGSFGAAMGGVFALCALALFLPTTLLGAVFPLTLRALDAGGSLDARQIGSAYAANTLGAIVGSFAGGFVVLPLLGLEDGLAAATLGSALLATLGLLLAQGRTRRLAPLPLAALGAVALLSPPWDLGRLNEGLFRPNLALQAVEEGEYRAPEDILYYQDGASATVSVEDLGDGVLALKVNGKVDASSSTDMPTQILAGALPMALHPEAGARPLDVAVIGFGSGVTVGAALQFPLRRLEVVEIEPAVVEAARLFRGVNHAAHDDARVHTLHEDGRNFLLATPAQYDVIISEPSNPWMSGVASLFTKEYFASARARLAPGGVFLQWVQLYEIRLETVQLVARTFASVFPEGMVFCAAPHSPDIFLVAAPHGISPEALARVFASPRAAAELARAGIERPEDLLARLALGPRGLRAFAGQGPHNTEDNGLLAFTAPRDLIHTARQESAAGPFYEETFELSAARPWIDEVLPPGPGAASARLARALVRAGRLRAALRYLDAAEGQAPGSSVLGGALSPLPPADPEAREARLAASFFAGPDRERLEVSPGVARQPPPTTNAGQPRPPKDDLASYLAQAITAAQRQEQRLREAPAIERALAWQAAYEDAVALQAFFSDAPEAEALYGALAYKVGLFGQAASFLDAEERGAGLAWALYFRARAEFERGEPLRADALLLRYLDQGQTAHARALRAWREGAAPPSTGGGPPVP